MNGKRKTEVRSRKEDYWNEDGGRFFILTSGFCFTEHMC